MCRHFMEKIRTNNKPKTKGNKEQNEGQTDNHYIQQPHKELKKHWGHIYCIYIRAVNFNALAHVINLKSLTR